MKAKKTNRAPSSFRSVLFLIFFSSIVVQYQFRGLESLTGKCRTKKWPIFLPYIFLSSFDRSFRKLRSSFSLTIAALRSIPSSFMRQKGVPRKRRRKVSSSRLCSLAISTGFMPSRGSKAFSAVAGVRRFQGQASWQASQPKRRLPILLFNSSGNSPRCSMVR